MSRAIVTAALLLSAASGCAPRAAAPAFRPERILDIAAPFVEAQVGGVTLRLRVDLDRRDVIELNRAAADRLTLAFADSLGAEVGRVRVGERTAAAPVTIDGITVGRTLSVFGRDCCADSEGAIGPDLLPYDRVRFVRRGVIAAGEERRLPVEISEADGIAVAQSTAAGRILVRFSLGYPATLATASAGAMLAKAQGGRMTGAGFDVVPAFGVSRPARMLALDRPVQLAGFWVARLPVRLADFGGGMQLPRDPPADDDIVVSRRGAPSQPARPFVLIGRDRLGACAEITYDRLASVLTLRCDPAR